MCFEKASGQAASVCFVVRLWPKMCGMATSTFATQKLYAKAFGEKSTYSWVSEYIPLIIIRLSRTERLLKHTICCSSCKNYRDSEFHFWTYTSLWHCISQTSITYIFHTLQMCIITTLLDGYFFSNHWLYPTQRYSVLAFARIGSIFAFNLFTNEDEIRAICDSGLLAKLPKNGACDKLNFQ